MDIKDLIKGDRYVITINNMFGAPFSTRITFVDLKDHGFDTEGGAWALYGDSNETPATFLICKRYRKRKCSVFNIKNIISIKKEWSKNDK